MEPRTSVLVPLYIWPVSDTTWQPLFEACVPPLAGPAGPGGDTRLTFAPTTTA